MANILDYLNWRGDLSFEVSPFNEVDALILSYLTYLDMDDCFWNRVPADESGNESEDKLPFHSGQRVSLSAAVDAYYQAHSEQEIAKLIPPFDKVPMIARQAASTVRFGSVMVTNYVNFIDQEAEEQMAAMILWPTPDIAFAAFRGTDDTIIGWKEDFSLSYLTETPGQRHAVQYLNAVFGHVFRNQDSEEFVPFESVPDDDRIRLFVGGHSKGGNLAVYSAAFSEDAVRKRIECVYANDSPGFREEIIQEKRYKEILPKVVHILPESSIIGGLLESDARQIVIKSSNLGLMQHDALSWQILGTKFIRTERSDLGRFFDASIRSWIGGLKDEERRSFTDAFFEYIGAGGVRTLDEIKANPLKTVNGIMQVSKGMPPERKQEFSYILLRLLKTGFETFRVQSGEKVEEIRADIGRKTGKRKKQIGSSGKNKSK